MCSTDGGSGSNPWDGLTSATQALSAEDVASWSDVQVRDGLSALLAEVNRFNAVVSTVAASFDTRDLADVDVFRTARSWLIGFGRMTQSAASGWLARGRLMAQLPALSAAAHAGQVSAEQLRPVVSCVSGRSMRRSWPNVVQATALAECARVDFCARRYSGSDRHGDPGSTSQCLPARPCSRSMPTRSTCRSG